MSRASCNQESLILRQSRAGPLKSLQQDHLRSCPTCSDALRVDRLLTADAGRIPELARLPDPMVIWWRSRQQSRWRKTEHATFPILVAERFALILGAVGLPIGLSLIWPLIKTSGSHWLASWTQGVSQTLPVGGSSLILAGACSLFVLIGFGLYSQWAES